MNLRSSEILTNQSETSKNKRRSNIAVNGLFLLTFVYIGKIQELFGFLSNIGFGKIVMGVSLLLYIGSPQSGNTIRLFSSSQSKYIAGIFVLGLISIPFSAWPGQSFNFILFGFLKTLVFFFLIVKVVNSAQDLKKLIWSLIIAVLFLAFFSVISQKTGRITVTETYDPNDLAMMLAMSLPIVYFFAENERGLRKTGLFFLIVLIIFAILRTGSRGGFFGLMTVGFFVLLRDTKRKWMTKLSIIVILGVLTYILAPTNYWERMDTILHPEDDYNITAGGGRVEIWKRGLHLMLEHPFVGSGAGAFVVAEGATHKEVGGKWSAAHNSFVQIGAESGIGALLLFIALIFSSIKALSKVKKNLLTDPLLEKKYLYIVNGLEIGLITYCVSGFFLSQAYSDLLYFLIANVIVLEKLNFPDQLIQHSV